MNYLHIPCGYSIVSIMFSGPVIEDFSHDIPVEFHVENPWFPVEFLSFNQSMKSLSCR